MIKTIFKKMRARKDTLRGQDWVRLQNAWNRLRRRQMRFAFLDGAYLAQDGADRFWFSNPKRARLIRHGLKARREKLARQYFLDILTFAEGEVVVDVGANVGEIGMLLRERAPGLHYIAFEPGPGEYECLTRNVNGAILHQIALWYEKGQHTFYMKSEDGDSSMIDPGGYDFVIEVDCAPLDEVISAEKIKLLKVEAEGAEPEVLAGAQTTLQRCEYVVVDAGYERGKDQEQTAPVVINMMLRAGFELKTMSHDRIVLLFRKIS